MSDRTTEIREALAVASPIRGDDPEGAAMLTVILSAAREYADLLVAAALAAVVDTPKETR